MLSRFKYLTFTLCLFLLSQVSSAARAIHYTITSTGTAASQSLAFYPNSICLTRIGSNTTDDLCYDFTGATASCTDASTSLKLGPGLSHCIDFSEKNPARPFAISHKSSSASLDFVLNAYRDQ